MRIKTTVEVYRAILNAHMAELSVFSSYTDNGGQMCPDRGMAETTWGFRTEDAPILEARSTWGIGEDGISRTNEQHEYWLIVNKEEEKES